MKKTLPLFISLCCVGANATSVNYDLLGRKSSKMNSPMVYKNVDYSKMQKNEEQIVGSSLGNQVLAKRASGTKGNVKAIVGMFGPGGYSFNDCSHLMKGWACGESVSVGSYDGKSVNSYLNKANKNFIKVSIDDRDLASSYRNASEAGSSRSFLSGYYMEETPYHVPSLNPVEASPYEGNKNIKYRPYFELYDYAYSSLLNKSNVGVYLSEEGLPTRLNPAMSYAPFFIADDKPMDNFNSMPGFEMRASKMYRALELTSSKSRFFVTKTRPSNPSETTPQIYMGLHADGGSPAKKYSSAAKTLDNYIYDNRTVEIVGAGNKASKGLGGTALAANAITVGALDPFTKQPTGYTAKTSSKPEVMNYSHYYFEFSRWPEYRRTYTKGNTVLEYKPFYDGTEAAAALTAGMVSNMLSANEFYRWHPEVVKAVMLNGQKFSSATRYSDLVFDQSDIDNTHISYYFIGDVNTLMQKYGNTKEIRLHFSKADLFGKIPYNVAMTADGFVASIAWLNSGTDIYNLGGLPQNFEIEGYWRHGNPNLHNDIDHNAGRVDTSEDYKDQKGSPYKSIIVTGFRDDAHPLGFTIRIILTDEDTRSENYGQMVLGLDIKPIFRK